MLVVKVEVWPGGNEVGKREIAEMRLGNISNLADVSDYIGIATENSNPALNIPATKHTFKIHSYPRKQSVWNLIRLVLDEINQLNPK